MSTCVCIRASMHVYVNMSTCKIRVYVQMYTCKISRRQTWTQFCILTKKHVYVSNSSFCIRAKVFIYSFFRRLYVSVYTCNFDCIHEFAVCIQFCGMFVYMRHGVALRGNGGLYTHMHFACIQAQILRRDVKKRNRCAFVEKQKSVYTRKMSFAYKH